uniref:Uncharacterized protein n=1 Tax=Leersia perrieri TaxID=77586 RepID=A0A0D9XXV7_9ORYZ
MRDQGLSFVKAQDDRQRRGAWRGRESYQGGEPPVWRGGPVAGDTPAGSGATTRRGSAAATGTPARGSCEQDGSRRWRRRRAATLNDAAW